MTKHTLRQVPLFLILMLFWVMGWGIADAQAANLLSNPGFESPYVDMGGDPARQVAQGWTPWHVPRSGDMPTFQNSQPEYAAVSPDSSRIRTGTNAQLISSFFATHDGGLMQRVTGITAGTELRFSAYIYVWSTTFDDRAVSEDDGDVLVQVGIDPTGGTDGTSANIVWSPAIEQYDTYREYSVIATASGTAVSVFIRSRIGVPVQYSNIYIDDAVLAPTTQTPVVTNTSVPATATTVPPTNTTVPPTNTTVPPTTVAQVPTNTTVPAANTSVPATATTVAQVPTNTTVPATTEPEDPTPTAQGALPTATTITVGATSTATTPATGGPTTPISDTFPGTILHTVRRNENVAGLAVLYGSTTEAIIQANGLDSNALIFVGQGLVIPVRLAAPATSTPTNTPVVIVVTATPGGTTGGTGGPTTGVVYIVQAGDTLSRIATRYNTTVAALAQLNGIVNPNVIQVGQRIVVPGTGGPVVVPTSPAPATLVPTSSVPATAVPATAVPTPVGPRTYVVQPGDNLFRISLRFNVSMQSLIVANQIANPNLVYVGQVLAIP